MSLTSRKFDLYGIALIPVENGGNLILPPNMVNAYLNSLGKRCSYIDEHGAERRFHYIEYPETVWIDKRLYSYNATPSFYHSVLGDKQIYEMYAEARINTLQDWIDFPFKADITVSSESGWDNGVEPPPTDEPFNILRHFGQQQRHLTKLISYLMGDSTRGDVMQKLEYLRMVEDKIDHQVMSETKRANIVDDSDDVTGREVSIANASVREYAQTADDEDIEGFYVESWRGLIFYELRRALLEQAKVNICQFCHNPIYLKPEDKPYRDYHNKSENVECYKAKDRADHKEHRKFNKKKRHPDPH
jgi:hypothetical protein